MIVRQVLIAATFEYEGQTHGLAVPVNDPQWDDEPGEFPEVRITDKDRLDLIIRMLQDLRLAWNDSEEQLRISRARQLTGV